MSIESRKLTNFGFVQTIKSYKNRLIRNSGLMAQPDVKPADTESLYMSIAASKGLFNHAGQNNCFLNSAVQVLWHLDVFRRNFRQISEHYCIKDSCIFCALKVIFENFQFNAEDALPPDALRVAMADAFADEQRFQLGDMDDAAECFENLLRRLHFHLCNSSDEDGCDTRHCITHQKFAMPLVEQINCSCGSTSEPFCFVQLIQYISTRALVNMHSTVSAKSFGALLHAAHQEGCHKPDCPVKCTLAGSRRTVKVQRTLMSKPDVVSIGLSWENDQPSVDFIHSLLQAVDTTVALTDMFDAVVDGSAQGNKKLELAALVCYYGRHYLTFIRHTAKNLWISLDDASVKTVGKDWADVIAKCVSCRYQPLLLIYQNKGATLVPMTTAPKQTVLVKTHVARSKALPASAPPAEVESKNIGNGARKDSMEGLQQLAQLRQQELEQHLAQEKEYHDLMKVLEELNVNGNYAGADRLNKSFPLPFSVAHNVNGSAMGGGRPLPVSSAHNLSADSLSRLYLNRPNAGYAQPGFSYQLPRGAASQGFTSANAVGSPLTQQGFVPVPSLGRAPMLFASNGMIQQPCVGPVGGVYYPGTYYSQALPAVRPTHQNYGDVIFRNPPTQLPASSSSQQLYHQMSSQSSGSNGSPCGYSSPIGENLPGSNQFNVNTGNIPVAWNNPGNGNLPNGFSTTDQITFVPGHAYPVPTQLPYVQNPCSGVQSHFDLTNQQVNGTVSYNSQPIIPASASIPVNGLHSAGTSAVNTRKNVVVTAYGASVASETRPSVSRVANSSNTAMGPTTVVGPVTRLDPKSYTPSVVPALNSSQCAPPTQISNVQGHTSTKLSDSPVSKPPNLDASASNGKQAATQLHKAPGNDGDLLLGFSEARTSRTSLENGQRVYNDLLMCSATSLVSPGMQSSWTKVVIPLSQGSPCISETMKKTLSEESLAESWILVDKTGVDVSDTEYENVGKKEEDSDGKKLRLIDGAPTDLIQLDDELPSAKAQMLRRQVDVLFNVK